MDTPQKHKRRKKMNKKEFEKVVKCFSFWKIDKRRGNYKLPNGERLKDYLLNLVDTILINNYLALDADLNACEVLDNKIFKPFGIDEAIDSSEQEQRVIKVVNNLIFLGGLTNAYDNNHYIINTN